MVSQSTSLPQHSRVMQVFEQVASQFQLLCVGKWDYWHLASVKSQEVSIWWVGAVSFSTLSEQSLALRNKPQVSILCFSFLCSTDLLIISCGFFASGILHVATRRYSTPLRQISTGNSCQLQNVCLSTILLSLVSDLLRCPSVTFPISFHFLNGFKQT